MFEIKDLRVSIEDKEIIKGLDLKMEAGQIHAVMGPNGAGKSSLAEALMGHPSFKTSGSIKLAGEEIAGSPPDERARKGLFLAFQSPEEVEGVKVSAFIRKVLSTREGSPQDLDRLVQMHEELLAISEELGMDKSFVSRELNVGFSGGEKKRLEILQMLALKPRVDGTRSFLIITHYPRILKYVKPDFVHILAHGRIILSGDESLAHEIEENGYSSYLKGKDV
jgi:Fe-S cluster assembly ATP-binding protein